AILRSAATYGLLILALLIEMAVFEALGQSQGKPGFLSPSGILQIFNRSADIGVMAVGMTFIILTAGIDLSVGSVASLCGVVAALTLQYMVGNEVGGAWTGLAVGYGAALAVGTAAGLVAGLLITWA